MQTSTPEAKPKSSGWIYASLAVIDGDRRLQPTHVGPYHVRFTVAPKITSETIEIIVTNGDVENRRIARVRPHDPAAVQIPIELI
jgi:hypothetical protein